MEIHRYSGFFLTGIHKPVLATALNIIRILVILIPLSILGSSLVGIKGIFSARLITDISAGIIGMILIAKILKYKKNHSAGN
jgi:hypothetical protein